MRSILAHFFTLCFTMPDYDNYKPETPGKLQISPVCVVQFAPIHCRPIYTMRSFLSPMIRSDPR